MSESGFFSFVSLLSSQRMTGLSLNRKKSSCTCVFQMSNHFILCPKVDVIDPFLLISILIITSPKTYFWMLLLASCEIHSVLCNILDLYIYVYIFFCLLTIFPELHFPKEKHHRIIFADGWWRRHSSIAERGEIGTKSVAKVVLWECDYRVGFNKRLFGTVVSVKWAWKAVLILAVHCIWTAVVGQWGGPEREEARSSPWDAYGGLGGLLPHGLQEHMCTFLVTTAATEQSLTMLLRRLNLLICF